MVKNYLSHQQTFSHDDTVGKRIKKRIKRNSSKIVNMGTETNVACTLKYDLGIVKKQGEMESQATR